MKLTAEAAKAIFVWHQNFQLRRDEMELTSLEINLPHNLDEIQSTTQTGLPIGLFDKKNFNSFRMLKIIFH